MQQAELVSLFWSLVIVLPLAAMFASYTGSALVITDRESVRSVSWLICISLGYVALLFCSALYLERFFSPVVLLILIPGSLTAICLGGLFSSWIPVLLGLIATGVASIAFMVSAHWSEPSPANSLWEMSPLLIAPVAWHGTLGPLMFLWAWRMRRLQMANTDSCRVCGYDLRGLRTPQCPECGTEFKR